MAFQAPDQSPLMASVAALITPATALIAVETIVEITDQTVCTTVLITFQIVVQTVWTTCIPVWITVLSIWTAVWTTVWILVQTPWITVTNPCHTVWAVVMIPCQRVLKNWPIGCQIAFIASTIGVKIVTIVCQMPWAPVTIPCHNVLKKPVKALQRFLIDSIIGAIPWVKLFQTPWAVDVIPCHNWLKKSLMPLHAVLIMLIGVWKDWVMAFQTVWATETNPFQAFFRKLTKLDQSCWPVFVFVKNKTNAATTAAIAAITKVIGLASIIPQRACKPPPKAIAAAFSPANIAWPACKPTIAVFASFEVWASFESADTASVTLAACLSTRNTLPRLPMAPTAPPTNPTIFPTLVVNAPTAVIAGPITGDNPTNPRINWAIELLEVVAHSIDWLIISSMAPLTPPLAAIALFRRASQLPPTCSIFEPMFCCMSLAWSCKNLVAAAVECAALSCSAAYAAQLVLASPVLSLIASSKGAIAFIPDAPNIALSAAVFWASPIPLVLSAISCRICGNGFILPALSTNVSPKASICFLAMELGASIWVIAWFKSSEAWAAENPRLVSKPIASAVVPMSIPAILAVEPIVARACCISSIEALDALAVWTKIAAACWGDFRLLDQIFIACWTTPAVACKLEPAAVEASAIAGNCFLISSSEAPLRAISTIASAASWALIGKTVPMWLATSANSPMFLEVPPAITAAWFKELWKFPKPLTALTPIAVVAAPATVIALPTPCIFWLTELPKFCVACPARAKVELKDESTADKIARTL